ncbi:unnamed protein product [Lactuca saligna]|uniref:Tyrosine-protein kinase catalytic domain-containing protein n=1 Tax=Lactuca saligna TaxID=75948 RepID=A0AA35ZSC8_LACSI|nr:unnamed protein product [Lactuca saligna]
MKSSTPGRFRHPWFGGVTEGVLEFSIPEQGGEKSKKDDWKTSAKHNVKSEYDPKGKEKLFSEEPIIDHSEDEKPDEIELKRRKKYELVIAHLKLMIVLYIQEVGKMDVEIAAVLRRKPSILPKESLEGFEKLKLGKIYREGWYVVDVFSFGITMWEILTGEEPYANMHCGAIIEGIVTDTLRPIIQEKRDPEWKKQMEQCWSVNPTIRPSFTEITNRLRAMSKALQQNGPK